MVNASALQQTDDRQHVKSPDNRVCCLIDCSTQTFRKHIHPVEPTFELWNPACTVEPEYRPLSEARLLLVAYNQLSTPACVRGRVSMQGPACSLFNDLQVNSDVNKDLAFKDKDN